MTRDEILNMPAGREMDALIAEKLMGWVKLGEYFPGIDLDLIGVNNVGIQDFVPRYSKDMWAAWEVVEKLKGTLQDNNREPDYLSLHIFPDGEKFGEYYFGKVWAHHDGDIPEIEVVADTAPLAICRAALLAVMEEK